MTLKEKLESRKAKVGVIGLGYVGLPLAVEFAKAGFSVVGIDLNEKLFMVISDVEMPEMDGYTFTTQVRSDPRMQDLFILLHTSLSGVFNNAMVEKVGADQFIAKFQPDLLAGAVLDQLKKWWEKRAQAAAQ